MVIYVRWKIDLFFSCGTVLNAARLLQQHIQGNKSRSNASRARLFVFLAAVAIAHVELQHQDVVGT